MLSTGAFMIKRFVMNGIVPFLVFLSANLFSSDLNKETYFNVLTYNVQMRPVLDNNEYKAQRISPRLNQYDIVAVQESFANKTGLVAQCTHSYKEHFTDKYCPLAIVDSGLSILSNYPVVRTKHEHFRLRAGLQDVVASKGILLTSISINGHIVDVYNTHMQASDGDDGHEARYDQALQMVEFVNRNSPASHSVLVVGDFNMSPMREYFASDKFISHHYRTVEIRILRTYAFSLMQRSLGLTDLSDFLSEKADEEIERILYRSGVNHELVPLGISNQTVRFKDEHDGFLSNGIPLVGTFAIRAKN